MTSAAVEAAIARLPEAAANGWLARPVAPVGTGTPGTGPLAGLPWFSKDLFAVEGLTTVAASKALADDPPAVHDSFAVARLRETGAALIGTTNMDSLAYGFVSRTELYGTARNPHDPTRLCGGSSGGSAAVVAAGIVPFALGTDTSGSVRVPAALCGVIGVKPSLGRFSKSGVQTLSPSLDHVGFFADTLDRARQVYDVLDAPDPDDAEQRRFADSDPAAPRKVGLLGGHFADNMEPAIAEAIGEAARAFGAEPVEAPLSTRARAAAYTIVAAEAARTHAERLRTRRHLFDTAIRDRLTAALLIPDAWIAEARAVGAAYTAEFDALFERFDMLIAPTVPCLAPPAEDALAMLPGTNIPLRAALGLYTQPISLLGLPVITVPLATSTGLPTGIQLIGPMGGEARLFAAATRLIEGCRITAAAAGTR